jgi:hypothetical protein
MNEGLGTEQETQGKGLRNMTLEDQADTSIWMGQMSTPTLTLVTRRRKAKES